MSDVDEKFAALVHEDESLMVFFVVKFILLLIANILCMPRK